MYYMRPILTIFPGSKIKKNFTERIAITGGILRIGLPQDPIECPCGIIISFPRLMSNRLKFKYTILFFSLDRNPANIGESFPDWTDI